MAEQIKLNRFGRYLILDHLVDGGMARICRARYLGDQVDKIVAIKMIRAQYSQNPSFRKMFMDEIKVTFGLIHPNIAQTYDYGIIKDQLYTSMEYVDGKNMKQYIEALKKRKNIFPIEFSVYIISQVCQALSYAHNFVDRLTGKNLNIIHRDISPHNIMITYDGSIKVIDFGIAKSNTNTEETQAGTIKGKLSYIAPEYLEGLALDHTYDQFAVGVTLWEMLCGRKLFHAENELAILKKIQECNIPIPSSINKKVPPALDEIVMKAVSKKRNMRFETMDQLNRVLVKFLHSTYPDFNAADLAKFAQELFKEEIDIDKAKFVEYGKIDIAPYLEELKKENEKGTAALEESKPSIASFNMTMSETVDRGKVLELEINENESREINKKILSDKAAVDSSMGTKIHLKNVVKTKHSNPGESTQSQNEVSRGKKSSGQRTSFALAMILIIIASLGGVYYLDKNGAHIFSTMTLENKRELSQENNDASEKVNPLKANKRNIVFKDSRASQVYFLNNREVSVGLNGLEVNLNQDYTLRIEEEGKRPVFVSFKLEEDTPADVAINIPEAKAERFGALKIDAEDGIDKEISFKIDGNTIIYRTPLPGNGVKVPVGEYQMTITDLGTKIAKNIDVKIIEDTVTNIGR